MVFLVFTDYLLKRKNMKQKLLKRISKIHAIKCNKTLSEHKVLDSFIQLDRFKTIICAQQINDDVNEWAYQKEPLVSEAEIQELIRNAG
jgi:hypothetical protein